MKFTNKQGFPELMYRALTGGISSEIGGMDFNTQIGKISVTTLASPARQVILQSRHSDEIEEDVSERLWLLLGNGVHYAFQNVYTPNVLQETRLKIVRMVEDQRSTPVRWEIRGKADVAMLQENSDRVLVDWKVGSVYSYIFRKEGENEAQLNMYWLQMFNVWGIDFDILRVWLIMRDWMESKRSTLNYPETPFVEIPIAKWGLPRCEEWLEMRLKTFMANAGMPDDELVFCNRDETWEKDPTYAVMKKGRKSALRVLDSYAEAQDYVSNRPGELLSIVSRSGTRARCERYCKAAPFCNQFKDYREYLKMQEQEGGGSSAVERSTD